MNSPIIDHRKYKEIVDEIQKKVPYYTPEWRFDNENADVGTALHKIVAYQIEETIGRFNEVLENNFYAFLNILDINGKPARASRTPLVFETTVGARRAIKLDKGTSVFGRAEDVEENVDFEIEEELLVHDTEIQSVFEINDRGQKIAKWQLDHRSQINIEGENLQENALYFHSPNILECVHPVEVCLNMIFKSDYEEELQRITNPMLFTWEYYSDEQWYAFDEVKVIEESICLIKMGYAPIQEAIRCKVLCPTENIEDLKVKYIGLKTKLYFKDEVDMVPDEMIAEGHPVTESNFMPFGEFFNSYSEWIIYSKDVFTKRNSKVKLRFDLEFVENKREFEKPEIDWKPIIRKSQLRKKSQAEKSISTVKWLYFNGFRWVDLKVPKRYEKIFYSQNAMETVNVRFDLPEDCCPIEEDGELKYGIKIVIEKVENEHIYDAVFNSPIISVPTLEYYYDSDQNPDTIYAKNNLEVKVFPENLDQGGKGVRIFESSSYSFKEYYFKFSEIYSEGYLNLLFLLDKYLKEESSWKLDVAVGVMDGEQISWRDVSFEDGTYGLTQTGILKIYFEELYENVRWFDEEGIWIRIVCHEKDPEISQERIIKAVKLNGVWCVQKSTVEEEYLNYNTRRNEYLVYKKPIHEIEIYINEMEELSQPQIEQLIRSEEETLYSRDELGLVTELWVKWKQVESFLEADYDDRVYTVDYLDGKITFGDGKRNRRLPKGDGRHIKVKYTTSYGELGNLEPMGIETMNSQKSFVGEVHNPMSSKGGTKFEDISGMIQRGITQVKTRNVPIAPADYESLIKGEFPNVFRARCYGNTNSMFQFTPGSVLMVLVPGNEPENGMDIETKRRVRTYIEDICPVNMSPQDFVLVDPAIVEIGLNIKVKISNLLKQSEVKNEILRRLEKYLDYRTGSFDGVGFAIGEIPDENSFFLLFKDIKYLERIEKLTMGLVKKEHLVETEINYDEAKKVLNGIVMNGNHKIRIY